MSVLDYWDARVVVKYNTRRILIAARYVDRAEVMVAGTPGEILTSAIAAVWADDDKALIQTITGSIYELGTPHPGFATCNPQADVSSVAGKVAALNYARRVHTNCNRNDTSAVSAKDSVG